VVVMITTEQWLASRLIYAGGRWPTLFKWSRSCTAGIRNQCQLCAVQNGVEIINFELHGQLRTEHCAYTTAQHTRATIQYIENNLVVNASQDDESELQ
jgi:hypothetical protein